MTTNLPANINALATAIESTTTRLASSTSASSFLKLTKQGQWVYGAEEIEVEEGSTWAINPFTFRTGYACWGDGELIDEAMATISEPPIIKSDLAHHGKPWNEQVAMEMVCLDGEDAGTPLAYTATSLGGRKEFKKLLNSILLRAREGYASVVPIITLGQDSYKHKAYGKIFTPVFDIVKWGSMDSLDTEDPEEQKAAEPEPEPAPAARRRGRKPAAEEPTAAAAAPRRSRRRA